MINARELFGEIDIYLFDQILKNRFDNAMQILDAGCGGGRNLVYFLRNEFSVYGVDKNPQSIEYIQKIAAELAPNLPAENFQIGIIENLHFPDKKFDLVISSAVLHFAENKEHFNLQLREMWRVLKPRGLFFARLASNIGIENKVNLIADGRYLLPDGSERFLVDEEMLVLLTKEMGGKFIEPIKTTIVQNLRSMTTWVLQKD